MKEEIPFASESKYDRFEWLTTSLPQLDRILGGGIPTKRITEVSGTWSIGKTTLALQVVAEAQKEGRECVWYDAEFSWDASYAPKLGVDCTKLRLLQTGYSEEALDALITFFDKNKNGVVVIDSIGAIHTKDEAEKGAGDRTVGGQAALVARWLRKVIPLVAMNNHTLIALNHEFVPIMHTGGGRPQIETSGGWKLRYHKSLWIRLAKAGRYIDRGEERVGFIVKAETRKNKLAAPGQECELELFYGHGFSPVSDLFAIGLERGLITQEGNRYFFKGEKLGTGERRAKDKLKEFEEELKADLAA